jgi:CheY-like chemotaxis protein
MGARVLVVDDSPTIRKLVSAILERHQYEPTTAVDGQAGLDRLRQGDIDLVLLDFVMPRMNGYQFCREMRADEKMSHLPVVLMSAKGDKIRGQFVQQTGALDAITKPFDARGLIAVVESALQKVAEGRVRQMDSIPIDEEELTEIEVEPEVDLDDSSLDSGEDHAPGFAGQMQVIPLAEVLQMLQLGRQTGTCTITNGKVEITVYIRDGLIDLARGKGAAEEFRLGRYLIEEGLVTRDELNTILKNRVAGRKLLGEALINYGLISEEDLQRALIRQTSELIYDALRWPKGRFSFSKSSAEAPEAAKLGLPVASIVMEGFRRVDEWRLIEGEIQFDEVLLRDQVAVDAMGAEKLSRQEQLILETIDGQRTVREILATVDVGSFDACKTLYQFLQSRLVRRRAA